MLAVIAGAVLLTGCQQKNAATVNVKVVTMGVPQPNVQVYMFRGDLSGHSSKTRFMRTKTSLLMRMVSLPLRSTR